MMSIRTRSFHRSAFTLIEVLVVITVISLLVAVMLPALGAARESGYRAKCLSGSRQTAIAVLTYATDNNAYVPNSKFTAQKPSSEVPYHVKLVDDSYAQSPLFTSKGGCPHGPQVYTDSLGTETNGRPDGAVVTYGLNGILQSGYGYTSPSVTTYGYLGTYRTADTRLERFASQTPLTMDSYVPFSSSTTSTQLSNTLLRTMGFTTLLLAHNGSIPDLPGRHKSDGMNITNGDGAGRFINRTVVVGSAYPTWPGAWPRDSYVWGFWWVNIDSDLDSRRASRTW
jgi:prepilin-type N-terminal cleavage/methylation domain-containing protein